MITTTKTTYPLRLFALDSMDNPNVIPGRLNIVPPKFPGLGSEYFDLLTDETKAEFWEIIETNLNHGSVIYPDITIQRLNHGAKHKVWENYGRALYLCSERLRIMSINPLADVEIKIIDNAPETDSEDGLNIAKNMFLQYREQIQNK